MINAFKNKLVEENRIAAILSEDVRIQPWSIWLTDFNFIFDKELCLSVVDQDSDRFAKRLSELNYSFKEQSIEFLKTEFIDLNRKFTFNHNGIYEYVMYQDEMCWNFFSSKHFEDIKHGTFQALYVPTDSSLISERLKRCIGKKLEFKFAFTLSDGSSSYLCQSESWPGYWVPEKDLMLP